jgi:hypothetical protein
MNVFESGETGPDVAHTVAHFVADILREANLADAARYSELPYEIMFAREHGDGAETAVSYSSVSEHIVVHSAPYLTNTREYAITDEGLTECQFMQPPRVCDASETVGFIEALSTRSPQDERFTITFRKPGP